MGAMPNPDFSISSLLSPGRAVFVVCFVLSRTLMNQLRCTSTKLTWLSILSLSNSLPCSCMTPGNVGTRLAMHVYVFLGGIPVEVDEELLEIM